MTRPLKLFALCATLWAAVYFVVLHRAFRQETPPPSNVVSFFVVFTVVLSSLETGFRNRDDQRAVRYSLPVRYSSVAAIASGLVASGWALAWPGQWWLALLLALASILATVVVARWTTRGRIKAYTKEDLFP
jgi:asparagine N-glycosylation enzyme membrane subunit Stt3